MSVNYVGVGVYLGAVIRQCRRPGTLLAPLCSPPTQATSAVRNTAPVAKVTLLWLGERRGRVQFLKVVGVKRNGSLGGHRTSGAEPRGLCTSLHVPECRFCGCVLGLQCTWRGLGWVKGGGSAFPSHAIGRFCTFLRNMCVL